MNDKTKTIAIIQMEVEVKATAKVTCQQCPLELEDSDNDNEEEAKANLIKKIVREKWYVGKIDSTEYDTEFSLLCPDCFKDIFTYEKMLEVDVDKKLLEML